MPGSKRARDRRLSSPGCVVKLVPPPTVATPVTGRSSAAPIDDRSSAPRFRPPPACAGAILATKLGRHIDIPSAFQMMGQMTSWAAVFAAIFVVTGKNVQQVCSCHLRRLIFLLPMNGLHPVVVLRSAGAASTWMHNQLVRCYYAVKPATLVVRRIHCTRGEGNRRRLISSAERYALRISSPCPRVGARGRPRRSFAPSTPPSTRGATTTTASAS